MTMTYLSAAELAQMRADVVNMLPDTCDIQAKTEASDGAGGVTYTWSAVTDGAGVACRVDPLSGRDELAVEISRETLAEAMRLTVAWDAPLDAGERVLIGGVAWEILSKDVAHSWRVSRRAVIGLVK
jgi:hypothetical protein